MKKTAIIAGATGLVGKQLLYKLIENKDYNQIIALVRKPLNISADKLKQVVVDFDNLANFAETLIGNDVFCCLGTTIKKAGSKANFRKVDFDYCLNLAEIAHQNKVQNFYLISALGSDSQSNVFYSKVKGELELAIAKIGFNSFYIFHPSLLLGDRTEFRLGEKIGQFIFKPISKLLVILNFKKYAAIESKQVANAMIYFANNNKPGKHIISNADMFNL